jgi:hypothetical protein
MGDVIDLKGPTTTPTREFRFEVSGERYRWDVCKFREGDPPGNYLLIPGFESQREARAYVRGYGDGYDEGQATNAPECIFEDYQRGSDDLSEHYGDGADEDEATVVGEELIVSGGDAAELLQLVEEALNQIALLRKALCRMASPR